MHSHLCQISLGLPVPKTSKIGPYYRCDMISYSCDLSCVFEASVDSLS